MAAGHVPPRAGEGLFAADLDGCSGHSGGPVVDERGAVLGITHNVDPPGEQARRGTAFQGGILCVVGPQPGSPALRAALRP